MNTLKCAVVGLGHQFESHMEDMPKVQSLRLSAVCDLNSERVASVCENLNIPGYSDYIQMFEEEDLDFVIIITPHDMHLKIVEEAAKRQIHVLKEKPLARNPRFPISGGRQLR